MTSDCIFKAVTDPDVSRLTQILKSDPEAINFQDENGLPALYYAALHRNAAAIELLIDAGAEIDIFATCYLDQVDEGRRLLLESPELVHSTTLQLTTPLHFAARKGSQVLAKLLVQHGADVNAVDRSGQTPLMEAAHGGPWKQCADQDLITLLVQNGAAVDLFTAAAIGRTEILSNVLAVEQDINRLDQRGFTALYHAAHNNHKKCVDMLIQAGADVSVCCEDGQSALSSAALHLLSQQCDPKICHALIAAGADYDIHTASALGDVEQVRALLQNAPELVSLSLYGFLPSHYAAHCGQIEVLELLLESGADPRACDASGQSLLDKTAHLPKLYQLLRKYIPESA